MATTTELRHRPTTTTATVPKPRNSGKKMAMARRGLKSLAIAISLPLALTTIVLLFTTSSSSSSSSHRSRPFWYPPEWAFHLATVSCTSLMGLSSWLAWAEGGFHRRTEALPLYLAQLVLGVAWGPLLFRKDSPRAAFAVAVGLVAALVGCVRCFRRVNPIAADLVKPCLAWAGFLVLFSYKLG